MRDDEYCGHVVKVNQNTKMHMCHKTAHPVATDHAAVSRTQTHVVGRKKEPSSSGVHVCVCVCSRVGLSVHAAPAGGGAARYRASPKAGTFTLTPSLLFFSFMPIRCTMHCSLIGECCTEQWNRQICCVQSRPATDTLPLSRTGSRGPSWEPG